MNNLLSSRIQDLATSARNIEHRLRQFDAEIIIDEYCEVRKRKLQKLWTKLTQLAGSKLRQIEKKVLKQNTKADTNDGENGSIPKLFVAKLEKLERKLLKLGQKLDKISQIHEHANKESRPLENIQSDVPDEILTFHSQIQKFEQQLRKATETNREEANENVRKRKLEKLQTKLREIISAKLPHLERKASLRLGNDIENDEVNVLQHKCNNPVRLGAKLEKLRKRLQKLQQKLYKIVDVYGPITFSDCLDIANNASCHALMNCLLREFVFPAELARYEWPEDMDGIRISLKTKSTLFPLTFTLNDVAFFVIVDRICPLSSHRYLSNIFCRRVNPLENSEGAWISADCIEKFAEFALDAICGQSRRTNEANQLMEQIVQSRNGIKEILERQMLQNEAPYENFLASEQGLIFGHYAHPAPKARVCPLTGSGIADFWPETRTSIQMHLIEVPKSGLWIGRTDDYLTEDDILRGLADQSMARPGYAILALHPLQAQLMKRDPRMQLLIETGVIRDIGQCGLLTHPTSSVRTLYVDSHPFQLKCALGIRITNCTRINPQRILESVIIIDQMINHIETNFPDVFEGIQLVRETAAVSWAPDNLLNGGMAIDMDWFRNNTGTTLRENFSMFDCEESKILLAATLFSVDITGQKSNILEYLHTIHPTATKVEFNQIIGEWFGRYVRLLTRPVIKALLQHGLAMEPHLQNVLVKVNNSNGYPEKVLVRDKEDFRFVHGSPILDKAWAMMSEQSRQFIPCTAEYAWARIVYCLFVNNMSACILALTFDRPELSKKLWETVKNILMDLCEELTMSYCDVNSLKNLIDGGRFSCKSNMKLRLANASDRSAEYQLLGSPWALNNQSLLSSLCCFPYSPVCPVYPY
ncbi:iucA / iucC family domain-containing protein [Ditylenchus destructor]|nr:iucA / iucC family domain-containing protein [Ditylenchus destructor]